MLSIGVSLARAGANAESFTRLRVLLDLLVQFLCRESLASLLPRLRPGARFVLLGTGLAAVVATSVVCDSANRIVETNLGPGAPGEP